MSTEPKIIITEEYLQGRQAFEAGKEYFDAADGITDFYRRIDAFMGFWDAKENVSVEERREAERIGESYNA